MSKVEKVDLSTFHIHPKQQFYHTYTKSIDAVISSQLLLSGDNVDSYQEPTPRLYLFNLNVNTLEKQCQVEDGLGSHCK